MGMYTELVLGLQIENQNPVIDTLKYMVGDIDEPIYPVELFKHKFFSTARWNFMLQCDSCYFDGQTDSTIKNDQGWYLTVRCNFKNYDDEIELFLDWLAPYIETYGFLGYHRYEEFDYPTLIYKEDGKIVYKNVTNTLNHA